MIRHLRPALAVAALLAATAAVAGPKEELQAAYVKFLDAHSFRATLTRVSDGKTLSNMAFVAPDRYRIQVPGGPSQVVVGDAMYMDMGGRTMQLPMPSGSLTAQYRNRDALDEAGLVVEAVGSDTVDGEPARVYAYTTTRHGRADVKTWVSERSGLPLQLETTGTSMGRRQTVRIRYADFDDPSIRIDAPR